MIDNRLAFIFPGQGSQSVGMLSELASNHPEVEQTYSVASEVLGFDLWRLVTEGPYLELNRTENTQPALLTASVAIWRIWSAATDRRPGFMAGHSLGEYSALVCAGALEFGDAVGLVRERGRLMQEAVPPEAGAMAAILGLDDQTIVELSAAVSSPSAVVSAANFNAPGQVVVAGQTESVQKLVQLAKAAGAKRAVMLPVSVPSHCALMVGAADRLRPFLDACPMRVPEVPVLHNVDVMPHHSVEEIRLALQSQMHRPVRWSETVRAISAAGASHFVECGPGKVLAGLQKRIVADSVVFSIGSEESLRKSLEPVS